MLRNKVWSPYLVGALIGLLSWFAFASADHPLGITTAFENTAALIQRAAAPDQARENPLFAEREAQNKAPKIEWEWMLVLGVFCGATLSSNLSGDRRRVQSVPELWRRRFGGSVGKRYAGAFLGGFVMMFGARLAQGCTSGHGISGILQLALASWIFAPLAFASAIITAFLIYGKEGHDHV